MRDGKGFPHPRSTARLSQMKQVDLQHRLCPMEKPPIWWLVARLPAQIECPDHQANPCHAARPLVVQTATPGGETELGLSPDRPCSLTFMFDAAEACCFEELPPMGRNRQSHVEFDRAAPRRKGHAYPNFTCNRAGRRRPGADFDGPAAVAADQPPGCASVVVTGGLGGGGGVSSRIRCTCANILRVICHVHV
jgi:hypothetical protein